MWNYDDGPSSSGVWSAPAGGGWPSAAPCPAAWGAGTLSARAALLLRSRTWYESTTPDEARLRAGWLTGQSRPSSSPRGSGATEGGRPVSLVLAASGRAIKPSDTPRGESSCRGSGVGQVLGSFSPGWDTLNLGYPAPRLRRSGTALEARLGGNACAGDGERPFYKAAVTPCPQRRAPVKGTRPVNALNYRIRPEDRAQIRGGVERPVWWMTLCRLPESLRWRGWPALRPP